MNSEKSTANSTNDEQVKEQLDRFLQELETPGGAKRIGDEAYEIAKQEQNKEGRRI